jgi:hypothetical protein
MVLEAHEECHSEYMSCPWCSGHIGHDDERHDSGCLWLRVKEEKELKIRYKE